MKEKRGIKKGKKMKKREEKSKTPERSFWTNLKSTYKYAKEGKKYMFLVLFATIICGVVGIITPIIGAMRIISITTSNLERLFWLIFLVLIVDIIWYGFRRLFSWSYNMYYFQVRKNIQLDMAAEVLKISQEELNNNSSGVFIDRISKDTDAITDIFTEMIDYGIELISRIGIFISIFFMNFYVGLSFLITTIIIYLVSASNSKKNAEALKKKKEKDEKQSGFTSEIVRGAKDIKILDAETSFLKRAAKLIDDTNEETFKYFDGRSKRNIIVWIMRSVATFLEWMLIYYFLVNKKLTVEAAVIIINYSGRIMSISNIFETILDISKKYNLAANRVFGILEENEFKKETFGNRKLKNFEGNIEFKNVKFSYEDKIPVLKGISFNIWANEKVGFVGSSGGGKTTIFNLISALNKVDSGKILFDGININELDKSSIRGNLSVISQNAYIFNMSIYDNLKIVKSNATKKEIEEACKLACLDEFINNLPDKYNTIVGEGGVTLSGGQKQRLAIARALLLKTEVILFDEATSALDNKTQAEIQKAIDNMKGEYTILIVAHRLSTVIDCDKLFVVDDGKIVATGTHKELLKKSKKYRELYERELDN